MDLQAAKNLYSLQMRKNIRDQRFDLNFLLKNMPKFSSTVSDDFKSLESTIKFLLSDSPLSTERKRFALAICIQGDARKAINMVESLLEALRKVFGFKSRKIVQISGELVRLYFTRLTDCTLFVKRILPKKNANEDLHLELFIEGLLPQYS